MQPLDLPDLPTEPRPAPSRLSRLFEALKPTAMQKRPTTFFSMITEMTAEGRRRPQPTPENPVGVQYYVIEGTSTLVGRFKSEGITYFTLDGMVSGVLFVTAADGSTISHTYVGSFAPVDATTFEFNVVQTWGDGTGRLEGVTGQADATALLDAVTGAFPAIADGVWVLP